MFNELTDWPLKVFLLGLQYSPSVRKSQASLAGQLVLQVLITRLQKRWACVVASVFCVIYLQTRSLWAALWDRERWVRLGSGAGACSLCWGLESLLWPPVQAQLRRVVHASRSKGSLCSRQHLSTSSLLFSLDETLKVRSINSYILLECVGVV